MLSPSLRVKTSPVVNKENVVLWEDMRVSVLTDRLFRIEKDASKTFCDKATQTVYFRDLPPVPFTVKKSKDTLKVITDKVTLILRRDFDKISAIVDGKEVYLSKVENLPGAYRSLDRCDGDMYKNEDETLTKIKLEDGIVSLSGVGVHDDTKSLIVADDGHILPRDDDEKDIYAFAYGKDFRSALKALFAISGRVPMIPRYAFGNWWSRYHAYTDKEYLHILDKLADRDIPLTVATIDMDWHWSDTLDARKKISESGKNDDLRGTKNRADGSASGWTGYSWNTDLFPDYKAFLKKIKERDLKITLNLHPARGIRYFEDMYDEMARAVGIDPATEAQVKFDLTSDEFINAYFDIAHHPYEDAGVEFWWIDWQQGTESGVPGLDPLWALNHYHTLDNARNHIPLILSRYCGIGSHRYPLGFSGDTTITWKSLDYIPYFTAMGTNAGYTWWSHDIGGHMWGEKCNELYARYIQFGVFSPINRLHCSNLIVNTKEPAVFMNGTGLVAEDYLRLRHRMIPFLYSASYETSENGQALIEPMYYGYPEEKEAYNAHGQYLFGRDMIVAPITSPALRGGIAKKKVWIPEGKWTDIFTGDEYVGGRWVSMNRWLEHIPVLAKEGAFFPLDTRKHTNSIANPDSINMMVFNGNGTYTLHEDNCGKDEFMHTRFTSALEGDKQTVTFSASGNTALVPSRTYRLEFRNIAAGEVKVFKNGKETDFDTDLGDYLTVILESAASDAEYRVEVTFKDDRRAYRNGRLLYNMMRIEGDHDTRAAWLEDMVELDDAECRDYIMNKTTLRAPEKARLCEAW